MALGWDVDHRQQHDPYRREVKIEKHEKRAKGRADYAFSLAPYYQRVRFFVEAKRPQLNIATQDNCFQAIRYSWPKGLPIAVLTDFLHIHIIDSRFRPNINSAVNRVIRSWNCNDFENRETFAELYWLLSREAVAKGAIENFAEFELPPPQTATRQYSLFANETREFDDDFLKQMDDWRESLASVFKQANNALSGEQLTESVQRALDRLVFIRFMEDKGIEPEQIVARFGQNKKSHWQDFIATSRRLDQIYNGIVFKFHSILDSTEFTPNGTVFADICDELTDDHSPYNFDSIPVEILGRIYERFLGKVVHTKRNTVEVVDKENVRKAGGVFYTPDYIVAYMVDQSLGSLVRDRKPDEILALRAIDTACGSGSFLIGTFDYLLKALTAYFRKNPKDAKKGIIELRNGEYHLSLRFKREVLVSCIYGVDIDPQAVEVAQLSLYFKLMEEETTYTAHQQQLEMGVALLPSLSSNIVVGNSLITFPYQSDDLLPLEKIVEANAVDFKTTFPRVFRQGGFDLLIGNPPYIKEYTNREAFEHLYHSPYYEGKMDIWYMFACSGLDWLKPNGLLAYIATNNWVTNSGAKKLREKITLQARIEQLIDFGDFKVFRDAGIQTMILIARKDATDHSYQFDYRRLTGRKPTLSDAQGLLEKFHGEGYEYLSPRLDRGRVPKSPLTFSQASFEVLLDKIAGKRNFYLDGTKEVAQGIVPNPDVVSSRSLSLIPPRRRQQEHISAGDGVFVVRHQELLEPDEEEAFFLKPTYEPSDVERYAICQPPQRSLIYSTRTNVTEENPLPPRLLTHLSRYKEIMEARRENQLGRLTYYHLHWPREERFFARGAKILATRKCAEPTFTYTELDAYVMMAFNVIVSNRVDLYFLTGLLNSRVVRFWLKHRGKMQGQNFQVDKEPLLAIPLCLPKKVEQKRLGNLVKRIIECKQRLNSTKTDAESAPIHRLIDQCEMQIQDAIETIYGLDDDERRLLEQ